MDRGGKKEETKPRKTEKPKGKDVWTASRKPLKEYQPLSSMNEGKVGFASAVDTTTTIGHSA